VTWFIQGVAMPGQPETSWRVVFLLGLVPAAVALAVRVFVKEPERWAAAAGSVPPRSPTCSARPSCARARPPGS
jgi:hypothetical protein